MSENLYKSSASKSRYTKEQNIQAVEYYVSYKITFVQTPITANIDTLKADLKIKKVSLKELAKMLHVEHDRLHFPHHGSKSRPEKFQLISRNMLSI